jgi:hypothetical protein
MKYLVKTCSGYWNDDPSHTFAVRISTDTWDGMEDAEDESIFYYTDGEPLAVGMIVCEDFVLTEVEGETK